MPTIPDLFPPVRIQTRAHGLIHLHDMSIADARFALMRRNASPRAFAEHVIVRQLEYDTAVPVASWSDAELGHVGIMWLKHLDVPFWPPSLSGSSLVLFQQGLCQCIRCQVADAAATAQNACEGAMQPLFQTIKAIAPVYAIAQSVAAIARQIPPVPDGLRTITANLVLPSATQSALLQRLRDETAMVPSLHIQLSSHIVVPPFNAVYSAMVAHIEETTRAMRITAAPFTSLQSPLQGIVTALGSVAAIGAQWGNIFQQLPLFDEVLAQWQRLHHRVEVGKDFLDDNGFGFTVHLWSVYFVASLAAIDPRVRGAVITKRLAAYTRKPKFAVSLEQMICSSPTMCRRWEKIQRVIQDHQRQDYVRSILVGMPEIDGMFRDLQRLRGQVRHYQGKWYVSSGCNHYPCVFRFTLRLILVAKENRVHLMQRQS